VSAYSSLLSRVREYLGPREVPTAAAGATDAMTASTERMRASFERDENGQNDLPIRSVTRWHLGDLEGVILAADNGQLRGVGQLWRAMRRDGQVAGVLATRTQGLVQLPMRFIGEESAVQACAEDFAQVFPPSELALLAADGLGPGVGVAEFVQQEGCLPVLRRLDPEFLSYRWTENAWFYQSRYGLERINPGDGRWVLHCPGGAVAPWTHGLWASLARSFIAKEHAFFFRENYSSKLANAARVATSPAGASENQKTNWFARIAAWGVNTVFDTPPGYDVKLLESNGRGYEVFQETIKTANEEIVITIAGQSVTTDGGAGFSNSAIHAAIRGDLIQADANALAATLNAQCLPVWAQERFGSPNAAPIIEWDVTGAADLTKEAAAMAQAATAIAQWNQILQAGGQKVDTSNTARRYGVPLTDVAPAVMPGADASDDADAEPEPDAAEALAQKMTEHAITRCEHGSSNRCRLCGVERVRDFSLNDHGDHEWDVAWRAIPQAANDSKPTPLVAIPGGREVA
jgi:hypothetical protein